MIRPLALSILSVLAPSAPALAADGRPPASPAQFFPAHTYVYLEINPHAAVQGFHALKLARLLEDPTIRALVDEALKQVPRDADPRGMLARYPFHRCVGNGLAGGLVGFDARTRASDTVPAYSYRFPRDGAVPADLFRRGANLQGRSLLAIRITDEALFQKTALEFLSDNVLDGKVPITTTRSVDGVEFQAWDTQGFGADADLLFTKFVNGYFLFAQDPQDLVAAVKRESKRSASLVSRSDFARFSQHRGDKPYATILHVGIDSAIELFSPLIPRRDREDIRFWGGFDMAGLQLGMGFHDGGICEWFHLAFAENAHGLLLNLSRLWPSSGFVETQTKRGTVYAASVTFDSAALYGASSSILSLCGVDAEDFERDARDAMGMDLRADLLAALGNTMGAVAVMPKLGVIPEFSFVFTVRNRAKMEKVLARITRMCRQERIPMKEFTVSGDGPKATYLTLSKDLPIKPAFVLRGDKLVVSIMPLTLKYAVRVDRKTGRSVADCIPDPTSAREAMPMFRYYADPAPMAENLYADLLKVLDSSGQRLPFDVTDLPSPEFVARSLSKFGVEFSIDPYFMSMDLHSPTGIAIPLMIGSAAASQQQSAKRRRRIND